MMIAVNELRVGSLCNHKNKLMPVANVCEKGVNFEWSTYNEGYQFGIPFEDINPIPLTPEWLERCGFKKEGGVNLNDVYVNGKIRLADRGAWELINEVHIKLFNVRVGYLHQLQNLLYSLTGEELNVRL